MLTTDIEMILAHVASEGQAQIHVHASRPITINVRRQPELLAHFCHGMDWKRVRQLVRRKVDPLPVHVIQRGKVTDYVLHLDEYDRWILRQPKAG